MKQRFLIVDAENIKKKHLYQYKVANTDGKENIYITKKMLDVKKHFEEKEIPEEFQKMILEVYFPRFLAVPEAKEIFFEQEYNLYRGRKNNDSQKTINGCAVPKFYDNAIINRNIAFETKLEYKETNEVIEFINELERSGCAKKYLEVLKELSEIDVEYKYEIKEIFKETEEDEISIIRKRTKN